MEAIESYAFLENTLVADLPSVPIISIPSTTTAANALKVLVKHNILCAPIYDAEKNAYIGLVDMLDLVTFIVSIFKELETQGEVTDFFSVLESGEKFVTQEVKTISDLSHRNPFVPVRSDANLRAVLKLFGEIGFHRLPVINDEGQVVNFLTQSAVVEYLATHLPHLGNKADRQVAELLAGCKPVVSVNIESRAIDAFKLMAEKRISAVAVVDEDGKLISNISARDIRTVSTDSRIIQGLFMPIRQFLVSIYDARVGLAETTPSITCTARETLGNVIRKLVASKVHRVYVVDAHHQLTGIVSLADVLIAITN
eukprot:TRINITY_DN8505_c0_g1_i1.p1 TRINITY_DN8505_c0_g1~~TRINITY_DN8505_c0_g1_i1.p1  ORF type:complete len:312 (-),score=67.32 TRINITY_DN8505_c0_g1_i1:126-1061(-)